MINEKIFKAYDIRGIYPAELNEAAAYAIGRAFVKKSGASEVVVGSDMRVSGPALKRELIRGITDEGANVLDIGLVSIDVVYFAVGILKYQAGIMITASHNPKEYNGFKMVLQNMSWVRGQDLRDEVLHLSEELADTKGRVTTIDILPKYTDHVLSFVDRKKIKPFRVVIDAGNGMATNIIPLLEPHLPIEVIKLNFVLDGNFPAHPSNPLLPESQVQIIQAVKEHQADFGVIFDGDTDRLFFVDEQGTFIRADYTLLILAKEFLSRQPGMGIVYNIICSKIVPEKITEWGGVPILSEVGFVNISKAMREQNGIMGGELSAHYSFRDNAYADSGFIAFLILLQLLSEDGRALSEIVKPFYTYQKSPEVNIEFSDRSQIEQIIGELKKKYQTGKQNTLDGLTVYYQDWWFNVRASNTEPLLRVTVEADTQEILDSNLADLLAFINKAK